MFAAVPFNATLMVTSTLAVSASASGNVAEVTSKSVPMLSALLTPVMVTLGTVALALPS